jgi:hypothetical protein
VKVRRGYLVLGIVGLVLLLLDSAQRWLYLRHPPAIVASRVQGVQGALTRAIMVAGQGLDDAESATSLRDLAAASEALQSRIPGRLEVVSIVPGRPEYSNDRVLQTIRSSSCDHLMIYLTGHGGGRNFGAVGGLNITRDALADTVSEAHFQKATIVTGCSPRSLDCWES